MKKLFIWVTQSSLSGADLGLEMKSFSMCHIFLLLKRIQPVLKLQQREYRYRMSAGLKFMGLIPFSVALL